MLDHIKALLREVICQLLAQCYDDASHRETVALARRVSDLERRQSVHEQRYWRPSDSFR